MNRRDFILSSTGLALESWTRRETYGQSAKISKRYYWIPQDFGVQAQFISSCKFFTEKSQLIDGRVLPVGLTPLQFDYAINEVYKRMLEPDMDHLSGRKVSELSDLIKSKTDDEMKRLGIDKNKPELLRKWLFAESVCAWVSTHIKCDNSILNASDRVKTTRSLSRVTLKMAMPMAICSGITRLTCDIANHGGVIAHHLGGEYNRFGEPKLGHDNHGWTYFDFGEGIECVADTTDAILPLSDARRANGKSHWSYLLPKSPLDWELFLARHYSFQKLGEIDLAVPGIHYIDSTAYAMTSISYQDWLKSNNTVLKDVLSKAEQIEAKMVKVLNGFRDITSAVGY